MGKIFIILLILGAIWVGMEMYNEGTDKAFGGIFAPIESARSDDGGLPAAGLTPAAQEADVPSERRRSGRVPITEAVRQRVTRDLEDGAKRRGY